MNNLIQAFEKQNEIIKIQSEIIHELSMELMQHREVESEEDFSCFEKMNKAKSLIEHLDGELQDN